MQNRKNLLWLPCFLLAVAFFSSPLEAQVTIGSLENPSNNALLDLKQSATGAATKGILLPRVALTSTASFAPMQAHEQGMCVYNTATAGDVKPGIYYNDGAKWIRMSDGSNFFYMPSILLPLDTSDASVYNAGTQTFTVNLYAQYQTQFGLTDATTSAKSSTTASLPVFANTDLNYFVTYFDKAVFTNVNVTATGVLTYKLVASPVVSEKTYMNIVLQVKQ